MMCVEVYDDRVIKRTNINLDVALLDRAAAVLGTRRTTDTVHAALEEVVAQSLRRRLAARDFPDLTPETLEEARRTRSFTSS
jgi:Arc/MetJ family transcription regulator